MEFDNFETLSYSAAPELSKIEPAEFTFITDENETADSEENTENEELNFDSNDDLTLNEAFFDDFETTEDEEENVEEDNTQEPEQEEDDKPAEESLETVLEETDNLAELEIDTAEINLNDFELTETSLDSEENEPETNTKEEFDKIETPEPKPVQLEELNTEAENILVDTETIDLGDDLLGEDLPTGEDITLSIPETTENLQQEEKQGEPVETLAEDHIEENVTETLPHIQKNYQLIQFLTVLLPQLSLKKQKKQNLKKILIKI